MSKVFVMDHPLIQHKIGWVRRKEKKRVLRSSVH